MEGVVVFRGVTCRDFRRFYPTYMGWAKGLPAVIFCGLEPNPPVQGAEHPSRVQPLDPQSSALPVERNVIKRS